MLVVCVILSGCASFPSKHSLRQVQKAIYIRCLAQPVQQTEHGPVIPIMAYMYNIADFPICINLDAGHSWSQKIGDEFEPLSGSSSAKQHQYRLLRPARQLLERHGIRPCNPVEFGSVVEMNPSISGRFDFEFHGLRFSKAEELINAMFQVEFFVGVFWNDQYEVVQIKAPIEGKNLSLRIGELPNQ